MQNEKQKTTYHTKGVYPKDDKFEESIIKKVEKGESGWEILREDGWSFHVPKESPVVPKIGMTIRFYGKGIGYTVRGLFIDGAKVFYRTEKEDIVHRNEEMYGKDAKEWLKRWDSKKTVWSIEMGGFGPGYEQALQIAAAEVLRYFIKNEWNENASNEDYRNLYDKIKEDTIIHKLNLSGAQWHAAVQIALRMYLLGPVKFLSDEKYKDRTIQVSKYFPNPYDKGSDE